MIGVVDGEDPASAATRARAAGRDTRVYNKTANTEDSVGRGGNVY